MRDVATLCDSIADTLAGDNNDIGCASLLESYADWRRADQVMLVRFTASSINLFGDARGSMRTLRSLGMLGFDLVPGVRRMFAKHTMGLAGRLPRLSRGVPLE